MIYNFVSGDETFTLSTVLADQIIQCCIAIAGLCLVTSMFELYTNVNFILIDLESYEKVETGTQL